MPCNLVIANFFPSKKTLNASCLYLLNGIFFIYFFDHALYIYMHIKYSIGWEWVNYLIECFYRLSILTLNMWKLNNVTSFNSMHLSYNLSVCFVCFMDEHRRCLTTQLVVSSSRETITKPEEILYYIRLTQIVKYSIWFGFFSTIIQ
jgi:hypothetical protein